MTIRSLWSGDDMVQIQEVINWLSFYPIFQEAVAMQDSIQIQQFLRFRRQNPDWLQKVKEQREEIKVEEKEVTKLMTRNSNKQKELESIRKHYEKIKRNTEQVIFQMKNQEDETDKDIKEVQRKKSEEMRRSAMAEEKIQLLTREVQRLQEVQLSNEKVQLEKAQSFQRQTEKYKQLVSQVQQTISTNEKWLSQFQQVKPKEASINISELISEAQAVKKSNEQLQKDISIEQKRIKKYTEDLRKGFRQHCEKTEEKLKLWLKKCDLVIDERKEVESLLVGINEQVIVGNPQEIHTNYKKELQSLSNEYDPEYQKQLGEFLIPYMLKVQGVTFRKSAERYFNNTESQQEIQTVHGQINNYKGQLEQMDSDIEMFKRKIQKLNKDISDTKQTIEYKKKR